ncbi:hypothetical protein TELCIR_05609, partial [Teladorsagia circumcincta]
RCECSDVSFSATSAQLGGLKRVQRISVSGHIAAYAVEISISDGEFDTVYQGNGNPMVVYSTLSHVPAWTHVDFFASQLRIKNAYGIEEMDVRNPLLMLTVCNTACSQQITQSSSHFTFKNNDPSYRLLNQGSSLMSIDIHVGGRPPDEFSEGIETSFTGCMARMQLNSVDLLSFAPRDGGHKCQMSKPPSLTLYESSKAFIPFSFLPFSFEFRILPVASVLLDMIDVENNTLLQTTIDDSRKLHLVSNVTRFKQIAHPREFARLICNRNGPFVWPDNAFLDHVPRWHSTTEEDMRVLPTSSCHN